MSHSSRSLQVSICLVALFLAFLALNARTLGWPFGIVDTPIVLAQAMLFSPLEYLTQPSAYTFLSFNNFTPFVPLSWDFDYSLFGLSEHAARMHQLLLHGAMLLLVFCVLLKLTDSAAVSTLYTFAVMNLPATYYVLDGLVNRHYIEGMIFALCSFLTFCRYREDRRVVWLAASVVFYGLAAFAKEVYLPLPGLFFFLLASGFRQRVVIILPYAAVLAVYLAARFYMIGGAGGYSNPASTFSFLESPGVLGPVLLQVAAVLFAQPLVSFGLLAVTLIMVVIDLRYRDHGTRLAIAVMLFGLLSPIVMLLPLISAGFVIPRWVFVPAVFVMFYLAFFSSNMNKPVLASLISVVVFSSSAYASYQRYTSEEPLFVRGKGRSYQALLNSGPQSYVVYSNFSQLAAENYSVWAHIAKVQNGEWGALPIVHPGQAPYHDLSDRKLVAMGRKARKPDFLKSGKALQTNVVESVVTDTTGMLLTFAFDRQLEGGRCSVYLFTPYNGIVFGLPDCRKWTVFHREVLFQLRKAGMSLDETRLAVWSDDEQYPWRSQPYALSALLDEAVTTK